jgi:multidrug efflux pump
MVVKTLYPGATALEVEQQVTDRLEKKIQELPNLDFLRSYSKPGESVIFVTPREDTPPKDIPELWYQVRKKVGDIRMALPPGIVGPFFNDEFGDTYSLPLHFLAKTTARPGTNGRFDRQLPRVKGCRKVSRGVQDEKIYVGFSDKKLAELGLDVRWLPSLAAERHDTGRNGDFARNLPYDSLAPSARRRAWRIGLRGWRSLLARRRFCQGHRLH